MATLTHDAAEAQLDALVKVPGALKIITHVIRPELRLNTSDPNSPLDYTSVAKNADEGSPLKDNPSLILRRPDTFILLDVVRLEKLDNGRIRAFSDDGSYTMGYAADLLMRLTEHGR